MILSKSLVEIHFKSSKDNSVKNTNISFIFIHKWENKRTRENIFIFLKAQKRR